jgi:hypothetical protein
MNTIALAICVMTIVGLWGVRKHVETKRQERDDCALLARNAWQARRAARSAAEARRGR